jgi:hypothetical protein
MSVKMYPTTARASLRAPRDLDHPFHAIVITDSTAS